MDPDYKLQFASFLFARNALQFGRFELRSKRISPYYLDLGQINSGPGLVTLGNYYVQFINHLIGEEQIRIPDCLFGPAYKGISIANAAVIQCENKFKFDVKFSSARKEKKEHGDASEFLGYTPTKDDVVLILDDAFSTGRSIEDARLSILRSTEEKSSIDAVVVALDRKETTINKRSAAKNFWAKYGIPVFSLLTVYDLIDNLHNKEIEGRIALTDENKADIEKYLEQYGAD
ncbi:orotate phosphoribosyltransferase [Candidatus Woesearchaeota archaeon]|nr:orotate phosphoribosyltransferase [Candidatus Woesearchaeota archaeon]